MRPPSPRTTAPNPAICPIEPVYGASRAVRETASKLFDQSVHGFAGVHSPGSHTPVSHGIANAGLPPCQTSCTSSECPPSEAA